MIELKDITLTQNQKTIFKDFNLSIKQKERLVILGASGSGKSTLLRLIAGLISPQKGSVVINGICMSQDSKILIPPYKRSLGMMFQDLALWPHLNVEGNIEYGLKIHKVDKKERQEKIKEMLALVQMQGYEKYDTQTLSGGEQQRVALARSLVLSPKILLMDEPLSSLDATLNQALRKQIVQLQEKLGFTLVYVTHNQEEAKAISTRLFKLE